MAEKPATPREFDAGTPYGQETQQNEVGKSVDSGPQPTGLFDAKFSKGNAAASVPWLAVTVLFMLSTGLNWLLARLIVVDGKDSLSIVSVAVIPLLATVIALLLSSSKREIRIRDYLGIREPNRMRSLVVAFFGAIGLCLFMTVIASGFSEEAIPNRAAGAFEMYLIYVRGDDPQGWIVLFPFTLMQYIVFAAIAVLLFFTHEVAWRGWLLAALAPLGRWPAILIGSVLWGASFIPTLSILDYLDFGSTFAAKTVILGCTAWGIFLGWLRTRSDSIFPPLVAYTLIYVFGTGGSTTKEYVIEPARYTYGHLAFASAIAIFSIVVVYITFSFFRNHIDVGTEDSEVLD